MGRDNSWRRRATVVQCGALGAIVAAGAFGSQAAAAPKGEPCPNGFAGLRDAGDFGDRGGDRQERRRRRLLEDHRKPGRQHRRQQAVIPPAERASRRVSPCCELPKPSGRRARHPCTSGRTRSRSESAVSLYDLAAHGRSEDQPPKPTSTIFAAAELALADDRQRRYSDPVVDERDAAIGRGRAASPIARSTTDRGRRRIPPPPRRLRSDAATSPRRRVV